MNPTILGVTGPVFLNQVPTLGFEVKTQQPWDFEAAFRRCPHPWDSNTLGLGFIGFRV